MYSKTHNLSSNAHFPTAHTPKGHKDGEAHGGVVIKQIAGTCRTADTAQLPVITHTIT